MIYGAGIYYKYDNKIDADLIMLGLLTQLKYISLVREIMLPLDELSSAT